VSPRNIPQVPQFALIQVQSTYQALSKQMRYYNLDSGNIYRSLINYQGPLKFDTNVVMVRLKSFVFGIRFPKSIN